MHVYFFHISPTSVRKLDAPSNIIERVHLNDAETIKVKGQ